MKKRIVILTGVLLAPALAHANIFGGSSSGGSGTPGGSSGQLQYNNGGAFGGFNGFNLGPGLSALSGVANQTPANATNNNIFVQTVPTVSTSNHTVAAAEVGGVSVCNSGSAMTMSLPQAGTTGFAQGAVVNFVNSGAGTCTISTTTSTLNGMPLTSSNIPLSQYGNASCASDGTNWQCSGIENPVAAGGGITIGSTSISGATSGNILYSNAGVFGQYGITGTGSVAMSASPTFTGTVSGAALTLTGGLTTNVTGSTQCLHVNSSGLVSGTGSDCGAGGGGSPGGSTTQVQYNSSGSFAGTNLLTIGTTTVSIGTAAFSNITGSTQCLHVNSSGVVSGTGSDCGAGGGGVTWPLAGSADSAAAPDYSWSGDTGTGMYLAGSHQIGFAASGSSVGTITSTGLNGIAIGATTASTGAFTTLAASGQLTSTSAGAASTSNVYITGALYTGGTGTTTYPDIYVNLGTQSPTGWNTNGTIYGISAPTGFTGNFADYRINNGNALFSVSYLGTMTTSGSVSVGAAASLAFNGRGYVTSPASGKIQIGNTDSATPTAYTLTFQNVSSGTSNTAGNTTTIQASNGTGTGGGGSLVFQTGAVGSSGSTVDTMTTALTLDNKQQTTFAAPAILKGYTVSALPTGTTGAIAYVTDATSCTKGGALTGSGSTYCVVTYNGSAWVGS